MRADVLFVSVILPILVMIGGWVVLKLHQRWLGRELAREHSDSAKRQK